MIHPEAIEATERLYNAWRTGQDVRVTDVINDALDKALKNRKLETDPQNITQIVCDYFSVERSMLFKKTRTKPCREQHLVTARWFVFLFHRDSGKSVRQIGRLFGFDHGTVLNGLRTLRGRIQDYPNKEGGHYIKLKKLINPQQP